MHPSSGHDQPADPRERVCVACPQCGQGYRVPARIVGRKLVCRHCRAEWRAQEIATSEFRSGRLFDGDSSGGPVAPPDDLPTAGSSSSLAIDTGWAGRTLGRYQVQTIIGQGGMGVVWRAHDEALRRDVALKILTRRDARTDNGGGLNAELFMQEARAIARLQHPSVVSIYEVAQDSEQIFLALELMEGGTLKEFVDRYGRIPPRELWTMMVGPARALALAHRVGIIHRDIKPTNLMFDEHGNLKLLDFGLAHVAQEAASQRLRHQMVGSLGWIAPETARAEGTTAASDIYCLGLNMLYALRGRPWLHAMSRGELLALHRNPPELDLSPIKSLTPPAAAVLRTCLAVDPARRYLTAGRLADALVECAEERPAQLSRKRRSHIAMGILGGVIGGLLVGVGVLRYAIHLLDAASESRPPVMHGQLRGSEPAEEALPPPNAADASDEPSAAPPAAQPPRQVEPSR